MTLGLTVSDRDCPHGHGRMRRQPGMFALSEVRPPRGLLEVSPNNAPVVPTGRLFTVGIFVCETCSHLELVDMGVE